MMRISVLDIFTENDATCFLCKTTLGDYLDSLSGDFREFFIQRGIVTNRFLDNIAETLINGRHIPTMVLVGGADVPHFSVGQTFQMDEPFRVLDGLQRTHRLKELRDAARYVETRLIDDSELTPARMARRVSEDLKELKITSSAFQRMLSFWRTNKNVEILFQQNLVRLEIWFSLTEAQQIQKMLILNAGHKAVNIKHQIELLFWSNYDDFEKALLPATIVREKDLSATSYSKSRLPGQFHFSQVIAAFVSLTEGDTVSTNAEYSAKMAFDEPKILEDGLTKINERVLNEFAAALKSLDRIFSDPAEIRWLGREVVLVGIFGAIGKFALRSKVPFEEVLDNFARRTGEFAVYINLDGFEKARNTVELSKVNIGNVNKRAVLEATSHFLSVGSNQVPDWAALFRSAL